MTKTVFGHPLLNVMKIYRLLNEHKKIRNLQKIADRL